MATGPKPLGKLSLFILARNRRNRVMTRYLCSVSDNVNLPFQVW